MSSSSRAVSWPKELRVMRASFQAENEPNVFATKFVMRPQRGQRRGRWCQKQPLAHSLGLLRLQR